MNYAHVLLGLRKQKMQNDFNRQEMQVRLAQKEIHDFFAQEPTHAKRKFASSVEALSLVKTLDFQFMKTHHNPPVFTKRILDAFSFLLGESSDWETQHLLLSDHRDNIRAGDAHALTHSYDCKLVHLYQTFDVFTRYKIDFGNEQGRRVMNTIADPRYRRDTYYVESQGKAAPLMIDMIHAHILYVRAAQRIQHLITRNNRYSLALNRMRAAYHEISDEYSQKQDEIDGFNSRLHELTARLANLKRELRQADDLAEFMQDAFRGEERTTHGLDYYQQLELSIESKIDALAVESCMEAMKAVVEQRHFDDLKRRAIAARALGHVLSDEPKQPCSVTAWITDAIKAEQNRLTQRGRLVFHVEDDASSLTDSEARASVARCVREVLRRADEFGNEDPRSQVWVTLSGRKIPKRAVYTVAWSHWAKESRQRETEVNLGAWETAFGSQEECARNAIISRYNFRFTAKAKKQGQVWAETHPAMIDEHLDILANEFEASHPEATAEAALSIVRKDAQPVDVIELAKAHCWNKMNPRLAKIALEKLHKQMATEFARQFGNDAASTAVALINRTTATGDLLQWEEHAIHWRSFHSEEYFFLEEKMVEKTAKEFSIEYPVDTHKNAATIVLNHKIASAAHDRYPSIPCNFKPTADIFDKARCWGIRNPAKMGNGIALIMKDFRVRHLREWEALRGSTEDFTFASKQASIGSMDVHNDFRENLIHKNVWLVGYLLYRQSTLLSEIEDLRHRNPLQDINVAIIRPSKLKDMQRIVIQENLNAIKVREAELRDMVEKLTTWFTYFGASQN